MKKLSIMVLLTFFASSLIFSQNIQDASPVSLLGLTPETAYRTLGAPAEIYALDAGEGKLHVVHFYPNYVYLFWFDNRVWQIRLDSRYKTDYEGIRMGQSKVEASAILDKSLGKAISINDDWGIWSLPYKSFPRRLKINFKDGKVSDAFYFRSDF